MRETRSKKRRERLAEEEKQRSQVKPDVSKKEPEKAEPDKK